MFFCNSESNAGDVTQLSTSPTRKAEARIQHFLDTGSKSHIHQLDDLEIHGWPAIHLALKLSLEKLNTSTNTSVRTENRILDLVEYLSGIAKTSHGKPVAVGLRSTVSQQSELLLEKFMAHRMNPAVLVEFFDHLNLWSNRSFWFFQKVATHTHALRDHFWRIQSLIPELDVEQLDNFAAQLRTHRLDNFIRLSLLLQMARIEQTELTLLFQLSAQSFIEKNEAFLSGRRYVEIVPTAAKTELIYAQTMNFLMVILTTNNEDVIKSFDLAKKHFAKQKLIHERQAASRFFSLLQSFQLEWTNPSSWRTKTYYDVKENVLFVPFPGLRGCEKNLD